MVPVWHLDAKVHWTIITKETALLKKYLRQAYFMDRRGKSDGKAGGKKRGIATQNRLGVGN